MKALISTIEPRESGFRVADIHPTGFETTTDFYWVDCPDGMERDSKWYDPQTQSFMDFPAPPPTPAAIKEQQAMIQTLTARIEALEAA